MLCEAVKSKLALTAEDAVIGTWQVRDPAFKTTHVAFHVSSFEGDVTFRVTGGYTVPSLRVREFRIVLCDDVTKLFYQILVPADDADAYLFYYGEARSSATPELYRMVVHIFGAAGSPAICANVLERAAADADPEDAEIALNEVKERFFVDNWVTSVKSEGEALAKAESTAGAFKERRF